MIAAKAIASAKRSHAAPGEETGDGDLARMAPQIVAALDFADPLKLRERWIEIGAVGHDREIEQAAAQGPISLIPFGGGAICIAPSLGGVVESTGVDHRPIYEIVARIVRIFVEVEYVDHGKLANRQYQPVCGLRCSELTRAGFDFLTFSAQVDGLANECARQPRIRIGLPDFVGFSARKSGNA